MSEIRVKHAQLVVVLQKGVYAYHSTWTLAAETGSTRNLNGIPFLILTTPILVSERSKSNVGPWEDTSYFSLLILL